MRVTVNLATKPFVELRPLFRQLRLAMGLLVLLAIGLGFALHSLTQKAQVAQARMDDLRAKTLAYEQARQKNEARMRQPQNMAVLARSQFLNDLFAKKSFSWTSVLMDLERVLPTGLQVTSIEPVIAKDGSVSIRIKVTGDRDRAVQFVRNLEQAKMFVGPRLIGESVKALTSQNTRTVVDPLAPSNVEFDVTSAYNPLPIPPALSTKVPVVKTPSVKAPTTKVPAAKAKILVPTAKPGLPIVKAVKP